MEEAQGHYAEAVELCARVLAHFDASPSSKVNMGHRRFLMARALRGAKREPEAQVQARLALELLEVDNPQLSQAIASWLEAPPPT